MIKAVRAGNKTQTRRVIKPQTLTNIARCPFGRPGDFLFCREEIIAIQRPNGRDKIVGYYADGAPFTDERGEFVEWPYGPTWLRPREMPLRFCRTALKIESVSVENICEISEDDCKAEGVSGVWTFDEGVAQDGLHYKTNFQTLWNSINGHRGYSWESNPLVWVIKFARVEL
jgi:hypothetical protein